ncbi:MAG: DHHA1 domain-containing protein [Thermoplasmata archaeon]
MHQRVRKAVNCLEGHARVRILSHYDADGISAAGILCRALLRKQKDFHATLTRSFDQELSERLKEENSEFLVMCDMGSGQIDRIEKLEREIVILDHHAPLGDPESIVQINPHLFDFDGATEGSASTISFLLAVALSNSNWDLCGLALAGAISDRQHIPEFSGLNEIVLKESMKDGLIKVQRQIALKGDTLEEGLERTIFPYFKGLSGRKKLVSETLKKLGLDPSMRLKKLDGGSRRNLTSYLSLLLMKQGVRPETVETLTEDRYWIESMGIYASDLGSHLNACGRTGNLGTGLSLCLGDREAYKKAQQLRERYLSEVMEGLIRLEKDGVFEKEHLQFFYTDNASYAGTWAGVGMQYLFNQEKPTIALSVQERKTRISGRGTHYLVSKGLNLAEAFRIAAESLRGSGGGHAVASGASIPKGKEERFLDMVDSIVGGQLSSQE